MMMVNQTLMITPTVSLTTMASPMRRAQNMVESPRTLTGVHPMKMSMNWWMKLNNLCPIRKCINQLSSINIPRCAF